MRRGRAISFTAIIDFLFLLATFFPFVCFGISFGTDTQPYALAFACLVLLLHAHVKLPTACLAYMITLIAFSTLILLASLLIGSPLFECLRSVLNYVSIAVIPVATYLVLEDHCGLDEKAIKVFILIWFGVGLVQLLVYKGFGSFLLADMRTSVSRGVNSLCNEPSFYGYMCMLALFVVQGFATRRMLYSALLVIQILFLAASGVSSIYLLIFMISACLFHMMRLSLRSFSILVASVAGVMLTSWLLVTYFPNMRITQLLIDALTNPLVLLQDQSVFERFTAITDSFETFLGSGMLPSLFQGRRIMSGYGTLLVDFGFVGAILIVLFSLLLFKSFPCDRIMRGTISLSMLAMMFSAVQLSNPLFSFVIGLAVWKRFSTCVVERGKTGGK